MEYNDKIVNESKNSFFSFRFTIIPGKTCLSPYFFEIVRHIPKAQFRYMNLKSGRKKFFRLILRPHRHFEV